MEMTKASTSAQVPEPSRTLETLHRFQARFRDLRAAVGSVFVGQDDLVDPVLTALFAGGHCLLEGLPGLGKTFLVRTLGDVLGLAFSRIQFTPDLMPADVTGTNVIVEDEQGRRSYSFRRGPIFAHLVLADEINRATPKTQSALLEAMQEQRVTVWGTTHPIELPLFVLATQNPVEMEGTYPLPEAQLDRFLFKVLVRRPAKAELCEIVNRTAGAAGGTPAKAMDREELLSWQTFLRDVVVAPHVLDFAARLVMASHPDDQASPPRIRQYVRFGASPRAAQGLVLGAKVLAARDGRMNVSFKDLRQTAPLVLRHRLILSYQATMDRVLPDDLVADLLGAVPEVPDPA